LPVAANPVVQLNDVSHLAVACCSPHQRRGLRQPLRRRIDAAAGTVTLRSALPWVPTGAVTLADKHLTRPPRPVQCRSRWTIGKAWKWATSCAWAPTSWR